MAKAKWTKGMKSLGKEEIRLRYSREIVRRTVYQDEHRYCFIDFYDQKVEVVKTLGGYYTTVEMY